MLFDLRSRGRRRTVQVVYLFLALLIGGGLVLFGVGAGNGLGGLLNGITGSGSNSGQQSAVSAQEKAAIKATQTNPSSAAAWANLVQARWSNARSSSADVNASTGQFTSEGKKELTALTQAYQRYTQLVKPPPDPTIAILAARAYQYLGNYASAASAWSDIADASPTQATAFECLAANAYAAGQTRKGDLAAAKALTLVPKLQRTLLQSRIQQAKTNPAVAQSC
jgi:Flp pilus assembly protein TadD